MEKETLKAYVITDLTAELAVEDTDSEYGEDDYAELDGRDLTDYEPSIRERIEKEKELLADGRPADTWPLSCEGTVTII